MIGLRIFPLFYHDKETDCFCPIPDRVPTVCQVLWSSLSIQRWIKCSFSFERLTVYRMIWVTIDSSVLSSDCAPYTHIGCTTPSVSRPCKIPFLFCCWWEFLYHSRCSTLHLHCRSERHLGPCKGIVNLTWQWGGSPLALPSKLREGTCSWDVEF